MQSFRRGRIRYDVKAASIRKLLRSVDTETGLLWQDLVLEGESDKEVTAHRVADSRGIEGRRSGSAGGAVDAQARHQRGEWCRSRISSCDSSTAWQARPECLHRVLQPDLSRRGSERIPVRLVGGGAGNHRRTARALQRNQAKRCAGEPRRQRVTASVCSPRNSSVELPTRRRDLTGNSLRRRGTTEQKLQIQPLRICVMRIWLEQNDQKTATAGPVRGDLRR
jgi:hypothetical protein